MNNSKSYQKVKISPYPVEAELFFNANYFLQNDYSTSPPSSSSSEEEEEEKMEVEPVKFHYIPLRREIPIIKRDVQRELQQQSSLLRRAEMPPHLHPSVLREYGQQQQQLQQHQQQLLYQQRQKQLQQQQPYHLKREMMAQQHQQQQQELYMKRELDNAPEAPRTPITRSLNSQHAELITKATHNHNAMLSNVNTGSNYKSPYAPMISAQQSTNMLAAEYEKLVDSFNQVHEKEKESQNFKLPSSKSPIMEALVYCSINKYGIELKELNTTTNKILFYVSDFNAYYKQSCSICSKQSPSEDIRARMKALQRWFVTFPAWRELEYPFELLVRPSHYNKMHEIISKMVRFYENVEIDTDAITDAGDD